MSDKDQIRIEPEKARQGRTGVGVRYMLIGGIAFALLAWVILDYIVR
jgi:hypothetical protein